MEEFIKQFMQKKCKDIKVDDIAENLGISKRTIYENFSSKDEIIKETLSYYQKLNQEKTLKISQEEENPLRKILKMAFAFINDTCQIRFERLENLRKHYPETANNLIHSHLQFMKDVMLNAYTQAQNEGYIFKEIEPEFLLALLHSSGTAYEHQTFHILGKDYNMFALFKAHIFTILRGVSTLKGIKVCDEYYSETKEILNL